MAYRGRKASKRVHHRGIYRHGVSYSLSKRRCRPARCHQPKGGGQSSRIFQESVDLQGWMIWESSSVCFPLTKIDVKIHFLCVEHKATCRGAAGSSIIYKDGSW